MNAIFKIKQNANGQSIVTSELAKNKGKTASILFSTLLGFSTLAIAEPVSIQGSATSENAVSVGSHSYATAIDGVATGQGSIATGAGFSRDDFAQKVAENQAAVDAVNAKQDEINKANNELGATNDAISSLDKQINDLTKQQADIANKITKRDNLLDKQLEAQSKIDNSLSAVDNAKTDLDGVSTSGKNLYLNFTDVLNSLNWNVLTSSSDVNANRQTIAQELQSKIETNYSDFAGKYTLNDYRRIVDGYLNRQASYQGSYEYFSDTTTLADSVRYSTSDNTFFNRMYFATNLDSISYLITDRYEMIDGKSNYILNKGNSGSSGNFFGEVVNSKNNQVSSYSNTTWVVRDSQNNDSVYKNFLDAGEDSMNSLLLIGLSKQKLSTSQSDKNIFLSSSSSFTELWTDNNNNVIMFGKMNFTQTYNNLVYEALSAEKIPFGIVLNKNINVNDGNSIFRLSGSQNNLTRPYFYDQNIGVLTKIQDLTVNNRNLISTSDIEHFKNFYKQVQDYYDAIDWDFDKSAINLIAYKSSLDKILSYNSKIDTILDLYQSIINERKKSDSDIAQIDAWTQQMMSLKSEVLDGVSDKTNFGMGIELVYNKEWADYYVYYAKDEADAMIKRINSELKLYDDTDELIVEATSRAKEIQKAYDDAAAQLAKDQAEFDKINKQIDELELTESEKAVDDTKRDKEKELAEREADKSRLEDEITKGKEELEKLREELAKTELKDLGLRSQAHGSNAFASGDDSIAMGTLATVTANDGIAIGRETLVTGKQSIAIGAESVVTGDKSIAIGVGHTVSGNRSTTIGDPNVVSGDDSFVAGNNNNVASNNVMVVGNSVSVAAGFDGAVILGDKSTVSAANPTSSITIQDVEYKFAGTNPTSVISVGSLDGERQIINVAAGRISETSTDAINGSQLYSAIEAINSIKPSISITAGDNIKIDGKDNDFTISAIDTNTQSVTKAGQGVAVDVADNAIGTKDYTVSIKAADGLTFDDAGNLKVSDTLVRAGDNVVVTGNAKDGFTVSSTDTNTQSSSDVVDGKGLAVTKTQNANGTTHYTFETKIGAGLTFGQNGEIEATGTPINAGKNITVTGDAINGYTISAKGEITEEQLQEVINQINGIVDTNTQSVTKAGQGVTVDVADNAIGTKDYTVSIKATDGLTFDDAGNLKVSDTLVKAGDNVVVTGNAKDGFTVSSNLTEVNAGDNIIISGDAKTGYTINAENMRTTVTAGNGTEVDSNDNADGSKNYTVSAKIGGGLAFDELGRIINNIAINAGDNVQVTGNGVDGFTISATDTNTQATVSAESGITVTESDNANGTKNYAVAAKLGKGLKIDDNGAIAAGVKGDRKNIHTTTTANGDVQVNMSDDIQVNSVSIHNGPNITQDGINANNTRITNVQDGVAPTDAVNVRQLNQQGNVLNQRIDNLANSVKKNKKRTDAGIAATAAMSNIPQVMLPGKSGIGVGVGNRSGQTAVAVGYSRASDNAKHIIKLSAGVDTQSKTTFGAGYMYQW